jgi:beta-lactam-binding protein with PASTA domain/tRNA A-37 threonylcarbamoyl transferase component Bud32
MIGRLLDGRYQVRSRIARGGMATVYVATDLRLERRVAVKIMHGHLADDSQYKARFIQEARSAARLAHPNVVNVYDQGQDADTAYLVMEYLPGITLRDLLNEHKVLTTEQAMDVLDAVLSGLAAAHKHGIVHRDLKPENVLLADDGRIKISDFGLARAAHANTASGNDLLGTIAYLSPELVTRGVADTRSDIYAIGIMLYEMLAGEQPFKGEQAFQIAHQHANDTVPTPSSKNPRVPRELDELVLWATARDPDQRPRDARAMLEQLMETQRLIAGDTATDTMVQNTMVMPAAALSGSDDDTQIISPVSGGRTAPVTLDNAAKLEKKSDRRRAKGYWLFGLVLLLAGLAGGTGWYFGSGPGALVTVPSVAGQSTEDATAALVAADLEVSAAPLREFNPDIPVDHVIGTDPEAGTRTAHGGTVTLVVSDGPEPLPIPELVGEPEDVAKQRVTDAGFSIEESSYQFSAEVAAGLVIDALGREGENPVSLTPGETYGEKQPVTLVVSLGNIPDVSGKTVEEAMDILAGRGLVGQVGRHVFHDTIEKGRVVVAEAQPDSGPVVEGSTVLLVISDGVEQVAVPDVEGQSWGDAKAVLEGLGFVIDFKGGSDRALSGFPGAVVKGTDPGAGTAIDKGATVKVDLTLD